MVFFDGFDVTKEIQYFKGVPDLVARGIACLIVDGPGNGESVRFRDQYLRHDTESYATAAYEWLAARPEIDPRRIGVMAISLGGYYAPRAARSSSASRAASPGARSGTTGRSGRTVSTASTPAARRRSPCRGSICCGSSTWTTATQR